MASCAHDYFPLIFGTESLVKLKMKIGVVGLGNILLGDEGFGVHFIRYLEEKSLPPGVELIDGGCLGLRLLDLLREKEGLFLVDVFLDEAASPGTIRAFSWEELKALPQNTLASAHQVGVKEALCLAEIQGLKPRYFKAYGVVPERLELGTDLSPTLSAKLSVLATLILKDLENLGLKPGGEYVSGHPHEDS